ncbi:MAG: methyltransferase domain-containing protein [Rubrobacteraceae bacterium]
MSAVVPSGLVSTAHSRRVVSFYGRLLPRLRRTPDSLAMHLGFWDGETESHAEAAVNMNRVLSKRVELRPGERVLDAGCGFGGSAIWLAEEVGAKVVGVNLAPDQIYHARRLAYLRGLSHRVAFEREDFTRTSFPDESFDVVWAVESVCHTGDKPGFLSEARRLLKPDGRLVVADFFRTGRSFEADEERLLREWLSGWAVPDLATVGIFCELARHAGFADLRFEDATANVWPSLRRIRRRAVAGYPAAGLVRAMGLGNPEHVSLARAGLRQYEALRRGLWLYGIFAATV